MIRRKRSDNHELLISQVEHARLAFEVARHWNRPLLNDSALTAALLEAISHHDDGWITWEAAVRLHAGTTFSGNDVPPDFMSIKTAAAIDIYRSGIQQCTARHVVAGLWVSRHFLRLAEERRQAPVVSDKDALLLKEFIEEQTEWQLTAMMQLTAEYDDEILQTGGRWLRFFDHLSLLVCCRLPPKPDRLSCPHETSIHIQQQHISDSIVVEITPHCLTRSFVMQLKAFALTARNPDSTASEPLQLSEIRVEFRSSEQAGVC